MLFLLLPTSNKIKNESKDQFNNVFGLYIVGLRVLCTNLAKLDVTENPKILPCTAVLMTHAQGEHYI